MVEYLSGGRIQGSSTSASSPPQTSWKLLDRTPLTSASDTIAVSFSDKDNLMVLVSYGRESGATADPVIRVGNTSADSNDNYASRLSANGGKPDDTFDEEDNFLNWSTGAGSGSWNLEVNQIVNIATQEKIGILHGVYAGSSGANTAPSRTENVWKWAETTNQIGYYEHNKGSSSQYSSGSEVVVLGANNDEADTGSNFWQELAIGTASGGSLTSGTFTAKKYLMVVTNLNASTNSACSYQFNDDTGANYNTRYNEDGGTDGTWKLTGALPIGRAQGSNSPSYQVSYIINKSDQEKLTISEDVSNKAGTGSGNAPHRQETVGKWANTSAQITKINIVDSQGISNTPWLAGSTIKVYGAD